MVPNHLPTPQVIQRGKITPNWKREIPSHLVFWPMSSPHAFLVGQSCQPCLQFKSPAKLKKIPIA